MKQQFDITRDAVIVRLSISRYGAKVRSGLLEKEAAQKHDADEEAIVSAIKTLRREDRAEIDAVACAAKHVWRSMTLPWEDDGKRLCPTTNYQKLLKALGEHQDKFHDLVKTKIVNKWDELVADAKKRLNGLAAEIEFPSKDQIAERYAMRVTTDVISGGSDVRLNHVDRHAIDAIVRETQERISATVADAQTEVVTNLIEMLDNFCGQIVEGKVTVNKTSIEKMRKTMEIMPSLNITGDEKLAAIMDRVAKMVGKIESDSIRENKPVRSFVRKETNAVLDDLKAFGSKGGAK
jgi:chromosome condensin MukBEF MukE localization factor